MKALLKTRCGCSQLIDIHDKINEIRIPLHTTIKLCYDYEVIMRFQESIKPPNKNILSV